MFGQLKKNLESNKLGSEPPTNVLPTIDIPSLANALSFRILLQPGNNNARGQQKQIFKVSVERRFYPHF
jgi:hypothetical protein